VIGIDVIKRSGWLKICVQNYRPPSWQKKPLDKWNITVNNECNIVLMLVKRWMLCLFEIHGQDMKSVGRYLLLTGLIFAALSCYLAGSTTGAVAFFIVGGLLELTFWLGLSDFFRKKR